jgi:hypothetical protein
MSAEPHMIYTETDRGFIHMPPIDGTYDDHRAKVYESSAVSQPCLWLQTADGEHKATVHLTVENALRLADQIVFLARNHYQLRSGDPIAPSMFCNTNAPPSHSDSTNEDGS